jgi:hypothetical protein
MPRTRSFALAATALLLAGGAAVAHHTGGAQEAFLALHPGYSGQPEAMHHGGHVHELKVRPLGTLQTPLMEDALRVTQHGARTGGLVTLELDASPHVASVSLRFAGEADVLSHGLTLNAAQLAGSEHFHFDAPGGEDVRVWVTAHLRTGETVSGAWRID